jgi:hypothetical protein
MYVTAQRVEVSSEVIFNDGNESNRGIQYIFVVEAGSNFLRDVIQYCDVIWYSTFRTMPVIH